MFNFDLIPLQNVRTYIKAKVGDLDAQMELAEIYKKEWLYKYKLKAWNYYLSSANKGDFLAQSKLIKLALELEMKHLQDAKHWFLKIIHSPSFDPFNHLINLDAYDLLTLTLIFSRESHFSASRKSIAFH